MNSRARHNDERAAAPEATEPSSGRPEAAATAPAVESTTRRDPQRHPTSPHSPALDLGLSVALATALIYAAGWAYAYRWFGRFDLGIAGLGLPVETFLMYGFWTLRAHWYLLLAYGFVLLLWVWNGPRMRFWLLRTAPFWMLVAFALAYLAGSQAADRLFEQHRRAGFGCFPQARVGLTPNKDRSAPISALAEDLAEREYRLLLQTPNLLTLIKPKPQGPPVTALVPMGSIDVLRLVSTEMDCNP